MTVDELIKLAREVTAGPMSIAGTQSEHQRVALACGVLDALSVESTPCGLEVPSVGVSTALDGTTYPPHVLIPESTPSDLSPDEARWLATALLRAADEAEQR